MGTAFTDHKDDLDHDADALEARVVRDISPNEVMFDGNVDRYFRVGRAALRAVRASLRAAQVPEGEVRRILDLPCGHGRVLRYLRAAFPAAQITACDLMRDGVDYCAATFGAEPIYSVERAADIPIPDDAFDLIWVGSLFTHLDGPRWPGFLTRFARSLRPGGVLVFSTHGREAWRRTAQATGVAYNLPYYRSTFVRRGFERRGFGYQRHRHRGDWGQSLSRPDWVLRTLLGVKSLRLVHMAERGWNGHHDIYACVRDDGWDLNYPPVDAVRLAKHALRDLQHRLRPARRPHPSSSA